MNIIGGVPNYAFWNVGPERVKCFCNIFFHPRRLRNGMCEYWFLTRYPFRFTLSLHSIQVKTCSAIYMAILITMNFSIVPTNLSKEHETPCVSIDVWQETLFDLLHCRIPCIRWHKSGLGTASKKKNDKSQQIMGPPSLRKEWLINVLREV